MNANLLLRRCFYCFCTSSSSSSSPKKKPIVFLGSPQVSAKVLDALFNASRSSDSSFEVAAIVTQPPARRDRGRKLMPSPVAQYALDRGFSPDLIFTPERASEVISCFFEFGLRNCHPIQSNGDALAKTVECFHIMDHPCAISYAANSHEWFLANLKALEPELCVTAAYGNILSTKFLKIPTQGTVNVHPSLLPLYRGAAPVQRALQDGVKETGVSIVFTVRKLDAGPVIASEKVAVDDDIKAPDLLDMLFGLGSELLVCELPSILDGTAKLKAQPQDDSKATLAPKITVEESWLSFDQEAVILHNKVRAFAGWPGTRAKVQVVDVGNAQPSVLEMKIITTRVASTRSAQHSETDDVTFSNDALIFPCAGGTALEVLEVQLPAKKLVSAAAFWNGMRGRKVKKLAAKEAAVSQMPQRRFKVVKKLSADELSTFDTPIAHPEQQQKC